jgi:hypothetical protein
MARCESMSVDKSRCRLEDGHALPHSDGTRAWPLMRRGSSVTSDAPLSDNPSGMYCPACRATGVSHCANPEDCGGMRLMLAATTLAGQRLSPIADAIVMLAEEVCLLLAKNTSLKADYERFQESTAKELSDRDAVLRILQVENEALKADRQAMVGGQVRFAHGLWWYGIRQSFATADEALDAARSSSESPT